MMPTASTRKYETLSERAPRVAGISARVSESTAGFERHAAIGFWIASIPLFIGNFIDLGTLWLLQRQSGPAWEFIAIGNTIDAYPRLALALGLMYPAVYFQKWNRVAVYRALSALLIVFALSAALLGVMQFMDFLVLRRQATPDSLALLRSTMIKGVGLSGVFFLLLGFFGLAGFRRPRR